MSLRPPSSTLPCAAAPAEPGRRQALRGAGALGAALALPALALPAGAPAQPVAAPDTCPLLPTYASPAYTGLGPGSTATT